MRRVEMREECSKREADSEGNQREKRLSSEKWRRAGDEQREEDRQMGENRGKFEISSAFHFSKRD